MKMLLGPILGYEGHDLYTVCFLSDKSTISASLKIAGQMLPFTQIANTPNGIFWRAEISIPTDTAGNYRTYEIESQGAALQDKFGRANWKFYIPGTTESAKIVYTTCNGFSSTKLARDTAEPYILWQRMKEEHEKKPIALLLMGGDQIYADQLWESRLAPTINKWSHFSRSEQIKYSVGPQIQKELDAFYEQIYINDWGIDTNMSLMLASIPSIMMWDDHDIFDGWGSYPANLQDCPVYQTIYQFAKKYFELFQIRSNLNKTLLSNAGRYYSWGVRFREYLILGLDNRAERTQQQIMGEQQWLDIKAWLGTQQQVENFLVMTGLPLAYRNFADTDTLLQATPWQEEIEDDVHDHWTAKAHQGERMKLIKNLLDFTQAKSCKTVILSGDVHIGSLGIIKDNAQELEMTQVVSSAIVHPAPTFFEWQGIKLSTSEDQQSLGKGDITAEIIAPFGSDKYILCRNYSTLEKGSDRKIWVNWICERNIKPCYPI
ncbi:MAG: alkaline phosphatase D family protein [Candidatus Competibacteraceae bacterium]